MIIVFVELKAYTGEPTEGQKQHHRALMLAPQSRATCTTVYTILHCGAFFILGHPSPKRPLTQGKTHFFPFLTEKYTPFE